MHTLETLLRIVPLTGPVYLKSNNPSFHVSGFLVWEILDWIREILLLLQKFQERLPRGRVSPGQAQLRNLPSDLEKNSQDHSVTAVAVRSIPHSAVHLPSILLFPVIRQKMSTNS